MVRGYERLGELSIQDVIDAIAKRRPLEYRGVTCYTHGVRLLTYSIHGVKCCVPSCNIRGEYFAIERAWKPEGSRYHLNLYGVGEDGKEVMITSDHRIPKSKGGINHISNRQPMCAPHNMGKGNKLIYT